MSLIIEYAHDVDEAHPMKSSLFLALVLVWARDSRAQTPVDESGLMRAAAHYVAATLLPQKSVALDTTRWLQRSDSPWILQSHADDSLVAGELGTHKVGPGRELLTCPSGRQRCDFHGVDAVVRVGPFAIRGDTGVVKIRVIVPSSNARGTYVRDVAVWFTRRDGDWILGGSRVTGMS